MQTVEVNGVTTSSIELIPSRAETSHFFKDYLVRLEPSRLLAGKENLLQQGGIHRNLAIGSQIL